MGNIIADLDSTDTLEGAPAELRDIIELFCFEQRIQAAFFHFEDLSLAQSLYENSPSLHIHALMQWILQQNMIIDREEGYRAVAIAQLCNVFQTIDDPESPKCWGEGKKCTSHFVALSSPGEPFTVVHNDFMDKVCDSEIF